MRSVSTSRAPHQEPPLAARLGQQVVAGIALLHLDLIPFGEDPGVVVPRYSIR